MNFIPVFPLGIVAYPGEKLNLHIFEPRYRQLIKECISGNKNFGIPVVIDNKAKEMGTLMRVVALSKEYESGEMDIVTEGLQIFKILEFINEIPDKLYSGAIVTYPHNDVMPKPGFMKNLLLLLREMHQKLDVAKEFSKADELLTSFDIAHHTGMSLEEEYELLHLASEMHRLEYIRRHLQKVLPVVTQMQALQDKIKLNGHFRDLRGFDLKA